MLKWLQEQHLENGQVNLLNVNWQELINVETLNIDDREPLELEQEAFVQAVRQRSQPQVSAEDAIAAMELAERIIEIIAQHPWKTNTPGSTVIEHAQQITNTDQEKVKQ